MLDVGGVEGKRGGGKVMRWRIESALVVRFRLRQEGARAFNEVWMKNSGWWGVGKASGDELECFYLFLAFLCPFLAFRRRPLRNPGGWLAASVGGCRGDPLQPVSCQPLACRYLCCCLPRVHFSSDILFLVSSTSLVRCTVRITIHPTTIMCLQVFTVDNAFRRKAGCIYGPPSRIPIPCKLEPSMYSRYLSSSQWLEVWFDWWNFVDPRLLLTALHAFCLLYLSSMRHEARLRVMRQNSGFLFFYPLLFYFIIYYSTLFTVSKYSRPFTFLCRS